MTGILDTQTGNIQSVANLLRHLNLSFCISKNLSTLQKCNNIIITGNTTYDSQVKSLRQTGLENFLNDAYLANKVKIIGICSGAQIFGISSEEGQEPGLAYVNMRVKSLPSCKGFTPPKMGWYFVEPCGFINKYYKEKPRFYFSHSYYMDLDGFDHDIFVCNHPIIHTVGFKKNNLIGLQFHLERSHIFGIELLQILFRQYETSYTDDINSRRPMR